MLELLAYGSHSSEIGGCTAEALWLSLFIHSFLREKNMLHVDCHCISFTIFAHGDEALSIGAETVPSLPTVPTQHASSDVGIL